MIKRFRGRVSKMNERRYINVPKTLHEDFPAGSKVEVRKHDSQ